MVVREHGEDLLIVSREAGAAARERHLLTDRLGSVTVALDGQGALLGYRDYDPYGSVSIALDAGRAPRGPDLGFSGKEHDAETGLSYFGGRYYQPGWGRWLTPDPLGETDGPNLYDYVGDNPTTLIDPNGLEKRKRKAAAEANRRMGSTRAATAACVGALPSCVPAHSNVDMSSSRSSVRAVWFCLSTSLGIMRFISSPLTNSARRRMNSE